MSEYCICMHGYEQVSNCCAAILEGFESPQGGMFRTAHFSPQHHRNVPRGTLITTGTDTNSKQSSALYQA